MRPSVYAYTVSKWAAVEYLALREKMGMTAQDAMERANMLREQLAEEFSPATITCYRLDNPYALPDGHSIMLQQARMELFKHRRRAA